MNIRQNRGITLIALIITIIVLLILAGVTLSILFGNNGLLTKTQTATGEWEESQKEEILKVGASEANIIKETEYKTIEESWGDIDRKEKLIENPDPTWNSIYVVLDGVPIPKGFYYKEGTKKRGLVIQDSVGNEFVWVPVDGINVKYEKWDGAKTRFSYTSTTDRALPAGVTNDDELVAKYKGFYIARYEAGIPDTLPAAEIIAVRASGNVSGHAPISQKNAIPWTFIDTLNAKTNSELMYKTEYVRSGLLTGKTFDTTMAWLESEGYNVQTDSGSWGNFWDSLITGTQYIENYDGDSSSPNYNVTWISSALTTKPEGSYWLLKTGNSENTRAKNIYDLAGNVEERTTEIYNDLTVVRGLHMGASPWAMYRNTFSTTGWYVAFRVVLYIL